MSLLFNPLSAWFRLSLWKQIIIALVLGIAVGFLGGKHILFLAPIGTIFIHAIQMMVVPVVFTAIVCAVLSIGNFGLMRNIAIKALLIYGVSMLIAATLGMLSAHWLSAGIHFQLHLPQHAQAVASAPTLSQALVNFVPSNPIQAFASGNVTQIFVFALALGFSIKLAGEHGKVVADFFQSFSAVVFKFARIIVNFAPYGVFALLACVFGRYGSAALIPLLKFVASVYLGCLALIVLYSFVLMLNGVSPIRFFKGIFNAMVLAYTTSSSAATLPVTFNCAENNLHISKKLSGFLLPLGTSLNLNGLSIYLSAAAIFAANIFGVHLHFTQYLTIAVTILFSAVGAAAVPGSALIVMGAVMGSVGIPLGALPLIAGVDRFNDMAQTTTNVIGDLFAATLVAKSEDMLETKTDLAAANVGKNKKIEAYAKHMS